MIDHVRRVVTGFDPNGKAVFVSDGEPATVLRRGQSVITEVWALDSIPKDPSAGGDPPEFQLDPPPGGIVFRYAQIPPQTDASLDREVGMHRTETVDFVTVMSGEIWLLLDDSEVHLQTGDCVVQRGTRHAWRNRSDKPCVIAAVLVSAVNS